MIAERSVYQPLSWRGAKTGLHWEKLDEDISIDGLIAGCGDTTRQHERAV